MDVGVQRDHLCFLLQKWTELWIFGTCCSNRMSQHCHCKFVALLWLTGVQVCTSAIHSVKVQEHGRLVAVGSRDGFRVPVVLLNIHSR